MNIALLGNGRTGGRVHDAISADDSVTDFNTTNPVRVEALKDFDVVISFLPGDAFISLLDILVNSKIPVINGSTGYSYPDNLDDRLKENNVAWVSASNFSIGMQLVHDAITALSKTPKLLPDADAKIHEIHHIHKKDSPSGTALKWQEWYGQDIEITSEKVGETVGEHTLTIETPGETITINHSAKDRIIFAEGAVWSARKVSSLPAGLHNFEDIL